MSIRFARASARARPRPAPCPTRPITPTVPRLAGREERAGGERGRPFPPYRWERTTTVLPWAPSGLSRRARRNRHSPYPGRGGMSIAPQASPGSVGRGWTGGGRSRPGAVVEGGAVWSLVRVAAWAMRKLTSSAVRRPCVLAPLGPALARSQTRVSLVPPRASAIQVPGWRRDTRW